MEGYIDQSFAGRYIVLMIKAIIFDLNGVFIKSRNLSERFAEDFGVPRDEFLAALREIMQKVRQPDAIECFGYWKPYLQKWGIGFSGEEFFDYWFGSEKIDPDLAEYAKKLKGQSIKLFILSNNFRERSQYYLKNFTDFMTIFDNVYFSWQTGHQKPGPQAYLQILDENDLKANECLYFDDSERNVASAKVLGIHSYFYTGVDQTRRIIEDGYLPKTNTSSEQR